MIDRSIIGREYDPFTVEVEKGALRAFAEAIGETNPIFLDETSAKSAGHPAIPAPLTYGFSLVMHANQGFKVHEDLRIDRARTVHGEQGFVYDRPIYAGDVVTGRQRIVDTYEKKGGALQFIVTEINLANQCGEKLCDLTTVIVVRNG
jgi:acyl dehydratase